MELIYVQEFTDETIARLVETLELPEARAWTIRALADIAAVNKQALLPHDDAILACMRRSPDLSHLSSRILLLLSSFGQVTLVTSRQQLRSSTLEHFLYLAC